MVFYFNVTEPGVYFFRIVRNRWRFIRGFVRNAFRTVPNRSEQFCVSFRTVPNDFRIVPNVFRTIRNIDCT